jgi:alkylresorcinol/alkylpyrone synthase
MATIAGISSKFPTNYYRQEELTSSLLSTWSHRHKNLERLRRFHQNATVEGRYMALPLDTYENLSGLKSRNDVWIQTALDLGEQAVCTLLENTDLHPKEISQFIFTTITGIAVPSIDARLMNRIPFSPSLKRVPIFGLGCLGGAAGIARLADYLKGYPDEAALLLSVELCSLTIQRDDLSMANLISSGLFGDGAAAVLMVGDHHRLARTGQPRVLDNRSIFFKNTEYIMGWDVVDSGFKILLSSDVAEIAETQLRPAVEAFLEDHGLGIADITHWITHPGGPKVIDAIEKGLGLREDDLQIARESLAAVGNISSTSVLLILKETLARHRPAPGTYGLLMAMGPAFCAEFVLLQW